MSENLNQKKPGPETEELLYRLRMMPETVDRLHEELSAMAESDDPADVERLRRYEAAEAAVKTAGSRTEQQYAPTWRQHLLEFFWSEDAEASDLIEQLTAAAESAVAAQSVDRSAAVEQAPHVLLRDRQRFQERITRRVKR